MRAFAQVMSFPLRQDLLKPGLEGRGGGKCEGKTFPAVSLVLGPAVGVRGAERAGVWQGLRANPPQNKMCDLHSARVKKEQLL